MLNYFYMLVNGTGLSPLLDDRDNASLAEGLLCDADADGGLPPLVFGEVHFSGEVEDELDGEVPLCSDLFGREPLFDIVFDDRVEDFIAGQRIEIGLVFPEFRRSGLFR